MDQTADFSDDRRKHQRAGRIGLIVRLSGQTYEVSNWSMGGFFLDDYEGPLSTGALVTVNGLGCRDSAIHDVNLPARIVRNGERSVAVNYLSLDAVAYEFLTRALSQCGQMRSLV